MMYGTYGMGWGGGMLLWTLFLVALIFFIVWLTRQFDGNTYKDRSLSLAKERYAKGEITKKEFEEIRKVIGGAQ